MSDITTRGGTPGGHSTSRPLYARPGLLLLVVLGGAAGTAARYVLEARFGTPAGQWPWATFWINITGSFLLGTLLTLLSRIGADRGWLRRVRLTIGTGLIGGYTTYSTFILEVDQLIRAGAVRGALAYAVSSVVLGITAALAGIRVGGRAALALGRRSRI